MKKTIIFQKWYKKGDVMNNSRFFMRWIFFLLFSLFASLAFSVLPKGPEPSTDLLPSIIGNKGAFLILSDDSVWEVDPVYRGIAQTWVLPASLTLKKNERSDYPYTLTNSQTKNSIDVRPTTLEEANKPKVEIYMTPRQDPPKVQKPMKELKNSQPISSL